MRVSRRYSFEIWKSATEAEPERQLRGCDDPEADVHDGLGTSQNLSFQELLGGRKWAVSSLAVFGRPEMRGRHSFSRFVISRPRIVRR